MGEIAEPIFNVVIQTLVGITASAAGLLALLALFKRIAR